MTIDLDSGNGLFDRLGKIKKLYTQLDTNANGGGASDIPALVNEISDKFGTAATNNELLTIADLQPAFVSHQNDYLSFKSALAQMATAILITMADDDNPLPERTVDEALRELIQQMNDAGTPEKVNASEPGSVVTKHASNDGNGEIQVSLTNERGQTKEAMIAEDLRLRFTSPTGFEILGETAGNELGHDYLDGSGASVTGSVTDPASAGLLSDNGFENWTTATNPTDWDITGTVNQETIEFRNGANSLEIPSSGTPVIEQTITGGVTGRTKYGFHIGIKKAGATTGGTLTISITDGTTTLNDEQGNALSFTVDHASVSNSVFSCFTHAFDLPDPLPATVKLKIEPTVAFDSILWLDDCAMGTFHVETYAKGPHVAVYKGTSNWGTDDSANIAISNTDGVFQRFFDQVFDTGELDLLLPSATGGAETIADTLATT